METILLVILVIVALVMIACVLIQRSEGGALGIGGPGAMFSARGSANFLTRLTAVLAAAFMALSLVLAIISNRSDNGGSVLDTLDLTPVDDGVIELKGGGLGSDGGTPASAPVDQSSKSAESQSPSAPTDN